jgi:hypothetical protein
MQAGVAGWSAPDEAGLLNREIGGDGGPSPLTKLAAMVESIAIMSDPTDGWYRSGAKDFGPTSGLFVFTVELGKAVSEQLKVLLETKHLYQKVSISPEKLVSAFKQRVESASLRPFDELTQDFLGSASFTPAGSQLFLLGRDNLKQPKLTLILSGLKLFCADCGSKEVANPIWYFELANELLKQHAHGELKGMPPTGFQMFFLCYQCQRCSGIPQAFLVRRHGWQLILEGRSPIEHIEIPGFIPKQEECFFRDAVIAYNSGKTLAALFYLRTFIEQFARRKTGIKERVAGEEILEAYNKTVPAEIRSQMPSLREWYERLSVSIHSAEEPPELFEQARAEIERHFDFRRIFRLG